MLPAIAALSVMFIPRWRDVPAATARAAASVFAGGRAGLVLGVGLGYASLGVALELLWIPAAQEIVLVVSAALLAFLLVRMGVGELHVVLGDRGRRALLYVPTISNLGRLMVTLGAIGLVPLLALPLLLRDERATPSAPDIGAAPRGNPISRVTPTRTTRPARRVLSPVVVGN